MAGKLLLTILSGLLVFSRCAVDGVILCQGDLELGTTCGLELKFYVL